MRSPYLCQDNSHNHDDLAGELMQQYGCRDCRELQDKLAAAMEWAAKYQLETNGGMDQGQSGFDLDIVATRVGRQFFYVVAEPRSVECPTYWRLRQASLCLLVMTHPVIRAEIESGRHKHKGAVWDDRHCYSDAEIADLQRRADTFAEELRAARGG